MSITVADIMKLPSMRGAKVLGGHNGLNRIVSSISVLEYAQINPMQTTLFQNIEFLGNELAITGFMNNPEDVEIQCTNGIVVPPVSFCLQLILPLASTLRLLSWLAYTRTIMYLTTIRAPQLFEIG